MPTFYSMRRRFQFSLRALLVAMFLAGAACQWLVWKRGSEQREREAAAAIVRRTGSVWYKEVSANHDWTERLLGNARSRAAVEVCFDAQPATDADLATVALLPSVERLTIYCSPTQPISPSGLVLLRHLKLRSLIIIGQPLAMTG